MTASHPRSSEPEKTLSSETASRDAHICNPDESAGYDPDYEDADGPGYFAENANCTWCGGEGSFWGQELPGYDPGWHDPDTLYQCPACRGTGDRKDQVLF